MLSEARADNVYQGIKQAQGIADIVCVQNHCNLSHREDETLISELGQQGIAYVPFFPPGGFTPLQSQVLSNVATRMGASPRGCCNVLLISC